MMTRASSGSALRPAGLALGLSVGLLLVGCSNTERSDEVAVRMRQPVIVGADDRKEVFELPPAARAAVVSSTVALFFSHQVVVSGEQAATLRAQPATDAIGICPDEAFASQPSAAHCSGVLIDDDLVATASHCLAGDLEAACRQSRIVFGFWYTQAGSPIALRSDDVYMCKRVVVNATDPGDFAVLQLDRAVGPERQPVAVAKAGVATGDRVALASHGAGLPLKVELEAEVAGVEPESATFRAATDTFAGSSGGPLLDRDWAWVGLVASGALDFTWDDGCARPAQSELSAERHQHALPVVAALCASGWPSRLCGSPLRCGDAICNGLENSKTCAADCPAAACGDGLCELSERAVCAADCNRDDDVPVNWPLSPDAYWQAHSEAKPPHLEVRGGCSLASAPNPNVLHHCPWLLLLVRRRRGRALRRGRAEWR